MLEQKQPSAFEPAHILHFLAIYNALDPKEAVMASEVASTFTDDELRVWLLQLTALSVPQAAHHIRVLVAGNTEAVS
jgi:hypothetical protein